MPELTGWGEAAAPSAESWNCSGGAGLPTAPSVTASLVPAHTATRGTAAQICSHEAQQSLDMVYSRKMGLLLPGDHWGCCQELGQLSMDHFTGVTGKSNYKVNIIFAALIEIPILRFFSHNYLTVLYIINIFIITHVQKILHCCKTSPEQIQEISTELQWRECSNSGFLRVARLCVLCSGNPHKAMIKINMKLCLNN